MKLYREPEGQWVVPGQQSRHALRVDIPGSPDTLADWLNKRDQLAKSVDVGGFIHPEGVGFVQQAGRAERRPPEPVQERPTLSLDDEWEALPLARKLHFAELAVADARTAIHP